TDLLDRWQMALAADAPNRFIINVQQDQVASVQDFLRAQGLGDTRLYPMIRGRLIAHNGKPTSGEDYADADERTRRRADREFNLSVADELRDDNVVTSGRFWTGVPASPELSVEEDFAESLGWKLGDRVG